MKKNITQFNNKEQRHGYWEYYYDGKLWFKCFYHNDKLVGYVEFNWYTGKLANKIYNL